MGAEEGENGGEKEIMGKSWGGERKCGKVGGNRGGNVKGKRGKLWGGKGGARPGSVSNPPLLFTARPPGPPHALPALGMGMP